MQMKRIAAGISAAVCCISLPAGADNLEAVRAEGAGAPILGDVNLDQKLDGFDLALARRGYSSGFGAAEAQTAADVDQSGVVDETDLKLLQEYLLGKIAEFPVSGTGIPDYGTPMDSSATMTADFRAGETPLFFASDGWGNGSCFDCGWYRENAVIHDGALHLSIDEDSSGKYNYSGGEYRTIDFYHYGYYETSMQAIKNDGVVSSFFTYTGPSDNNPWDEIDIEILGKDTTKVQFNYYTNGVGNHEYLYDLGFDASEGYHTYGFEWQPEYIAWYVDGVEVYRATGNLPTTPGKIMMNTWPGIGVDSWLNAYDGTTPLTARYQWVTYNKQ